MIYYDVVISGGGMVGASLAISLAQSGFKVLVVESVSPNLAMKHKSNTPDLRVSAISYASVKLLRRINVWTRIDAHFRVPYRRLEAWEWSSSTIIFEATMLRLPELGFMVENWRLQEALWNSFSYYGIVLYCPAFLKTIHYAEGYWHIILDDDRPVISRLLIGADGADSQVRLKSGIMVSGWQYRQSCMLLSVETEKCQQDITWQMFTPSGPRAFLPLYDNWASLVWYDSAARIRQLQNLPIWVLERELQENFPQRLGKIKLRGAASFPLLRRHAAHNYIRPGLALVGDAAHTIHPLAGQGVNLGFRDAKCLAEVLTSAYDKGEPWYQREILERYQNFRRVDNLLMQTGIDLLYTIFNNNLLPLKLTRNLALISVQHISGLKERLLKYALGL